MASTASKNSKGIGNSLREKFENVEGALLGATRLGKKDWKSFEDWNDKFVTPVENGLTDFINDIEGDYFHTDSQSNLKADELLFITLKSTVNSLKPNMTYNEVKKSFKVPFKMASDLCQQQNASMVRLSGVLPALFAQEPIKVRNLTRDFFDGFDKIFDEFLKMSERERGVKGDIKEFMKKKRIDNFNDDFSALVKKRKKKLDEMEGLHYEMHFKKLLPNFKLLWDAKKITYDMENAEKVVTDAKQECKDFVDGILQISADHNSKMESDLNNKDYMQKAEKIFEKLDKIK